VRKQHLELLTGTAINKRLEPLDEEGNMKRRAEDTMQSQNRESVKERKTTCIRKMVVRDRESEESGEIDGKKICDGNELNDAWFQATASM
jgi:hypothetical protein